jgi:hypothetical protein
MSAPAGTLRSLEHRLGNLRRTRDQDFTGSGPKRSLALDGGGLRGILTFGILKRVEDELRTTRLWCVQSILRAGSLKS